MADLQTFWATGFWATGFWADDFWAGGVVPPVPVVVEPSGGGRRLRNRYRPLSKRERKELDRLFQQNVKPRYVAPPEPVTVTKRTAPLVITLPPDEPGPITKPAERIAAAKHFLALDAIEAFLDQLSAPFADRYAHVLAQQYAQRLAAEQERIALAREAERLKLARIAAAMEAQRIADEAEMLDVVMLVHEDVI